MKLKIYVKSDIGKTRKENQDIFRYGTIKKNIVWALVCDGMGGANAGKEASEIVCDYIRNKMEKYLKKSENINQLLAETLKEANEIVFKKSQSEEKYNGMGTTAVLGVIIENKKYICYVGDSRAYSIVGNQIDQLTIDHSVVQEMVDLGEITKEEAKNHPKKNIITQAIGIKKEIKLGFIECDCKKGDILLLCTDGLTNYVEDHDILDCILNNEFEKSVDILIDKANEMGGNDNITALIVYI